ncbi:glycosyltransferase family 1 protein [Niabella terrae]
MTMAKRIGIEVQRLFRPRKHGMEIVALELLKQIQELDRQNEYVLFAREDADRDCLQATDNFQIQALAGSNYIQWEQFVLPRYARKAGIDFLHSTCNTSSLRQVAPLMLTLHDIIYLESLNFKGSTYQNFGNLYRRWIVPKLVRRSKIVVTVSNFEKDTIIEQLKVPEEKVKVVYNAVNPRFNNSYAEQDLTAFRSKYQLPDAFVLFLGNTAPKKNTQNVISAYLEYLTATTDPIPLVILDYDKSLLAARLQETGQSALMKHFLFPGFITAAEMPLMYNAASLFLYPSLRESFGLPILEAMGCGTPVVTSNTSSMPEVGGNAAVYTDPYKVQDIAEKMSDLLKDPVRAQQLSEAGLQRAAEFSWKAAATQLLELYKIM